MTETYRYDAFGTLTSIQSLNENGVLVEVETALSRFLYAGEQEKYMDIVDLMLQFRKSGDTKLLLTSETNISKDILNVIVVEILSWLKLEKKEVCG